MAWLKNPVMLVSSIIMASLVAPSFAEGESELLVRDHELIALESVGIPVMETHLEGFKELGGIPEAYERVHEYIVGRSSDCDASERYRRSEGVCNNLENPLYGAAIAFQQRLFATSRAIKVMDKAVFPNAYMDSSRIPRLTGVNGKYLPTARTVSTDCLPKSEETDTFLDRRATMLQFQFGQYLDHDLIHTEEITGGDDCCHGGLQTCVHPDIVTGGPCFPITVVRNDRHFNKSCLDFKRSFAVDVDGVFEQINGVTSFVDASTVYGSNRGHQRSLRTLVGGEMKVDLGNRLPKQHGNFACFKSFQGEESECPAAGDFRVNEFGGLTVLHLMFVREHNRIAQRFQRINPHWNDERIFQETRRIIIAFHQKIVYEDFLPPLLGQKAIKFFNLEPDTYHYDPKVNPTIVNEFGVAAFRFGHLMINSIIRFDGRNTDISETFFRAHTVMSTEQSIRDIIRFQSSNRAQKFDQHMSMQLTDLLFDGLEGESISSDLGARNIQRGRDHGALPYLSYFNLANKGFIQHVHDIEYDPALPECLQEKNYDVVEDVDLFVGGVYERPIDDGIVGPTFSYIIADQFWRIKFGDRFFYETDDPILRFRPDQLNAIKEQSLSHIYCRNSNVRSIQPNAFRVSSDTNRKRNCRTFDDIDLSLWRETPPVDSYDSDSDSDE